MGKASRKQRKARTTQNQPVRHEQNEVVKSAPVNNVQEHRPSQCTRPAYGTRYLCI